MHDRKSALEALQLAIDYADDLAEYASLKEQAKAARDLLLKHG
ncbi:hypothetical protein DB43_EA00010 [Parachlamydia acanthamoebae]|uniref:Uncharacterized protein n=1 Tax=Parachlamydia acanthamoebae TaxID=83552 RepID=A0A0C1EQB2_9BACT|nr:hypothetical protein DB43_EA00010 [Parachlamydia acanthamoebae]